MERMNEKMRNSAQMNEKKKKAIITGENESEMKLSGIKE